MSSEVEKLLEDTLEKLERGIRYGEMREMLNQALALLRSKPPAGEFTKHLREQVIYVAEMVKGEHPEEEIDWLEMFEQINEACNLLDAKIEEIEKLRAFCLRESNVLKEAYKRTHNKSMIRVVADSLAEHALKELK